jgi:segregation and condensation protein B
MMSKEKKETGRSKKNTNLEFFKGDQWLKSCVEGVLFISEGLVKASEISSILKIKEKKVYEIIDLLEKEYADNNRGFILKRVAGGFRLYSNPALNDVLIRFAKSNIRTHLSQAALETLAIISYRQPVTRTQVAEIRGVRTDSVILTLVDKGLIKEAGKLKEPGSPLLYKTTDRFLELLGIDSIKDLPPLEFMKENNEEKQD